MTTKEQNIIKQYNNGATTRELCLQYGHNLNNRHAILDVLKKFNIPIRNDNETCAIKYKVNSNYFENIDDQYKAYILGFIYADGNISRNCLRIQLAEQDSHILYDIRNCLESNHPIKTTYIKETNRQNLVTLNISNKKIVQDLSTLGVVPAKTHKLSKIPNLREDLISHFIRGYFDGDGCISVSKAKRMIQLTYLLLIVGNEDFLIDIQNQFIKSLNLNKTKLLVRHKDRDNNIKSLSYGGRNQIKLLFNYLYKESNIHLTRKYNKFIGVFN